MHERKYKEILDEDIEYEPEDAGYIEIWSYEDEHNQLKNDVSQGPLQERGLEEWLDQKYTCPPPGVELGGLRLIHRQLGSEDIVKPLSTMPFSKTILTRIIDTFCLPRAYLEATCSTLGSTARFTKVTGPTETGRLGFLFNSPGFLGSHYSVAVSYDIQAGISRAMINGLGKRWMLNDLLELLRECSEFALHPMLVPIMAAEVYLARLYEQDGSTDDTIQELELATGQQDYAGRDNIVEPMKIDFMSVTKRLNNMCGVLGQLELRAEYQRHQLQKMILYMDGLLKLPLDPRRKERILQISRPLEEHVEYLASRTESVMLSIRDKQQTARTQLAVVYNFMGQRDNKLNIEVARDSKSIAAESKRDSSSMKTIAVLTIVFLPGTFVAALFSMPMFNWQADSTTAVVSPRFWVYWAITAPLTIVVVLIWFIWIALKDARHRREDLEMAQAYESDGKGKQKDSEEETSGRESSSASSRSSRSNAAVPRTGPSPKCQTNDADAEGHIEHSQHSGSRRSSRLSQQSRQTRLNRDQVSSEPTPAPPASGRKPWKVPRDLVLTSRALLGLSAPQEKQN